MQACQISDFFNMKSFSLHSVHSTKGNTIHAPKQFNFSYLEIQTQQILI